MEDSAKNRKNTVINNDLEAETKRLIEESSKRLAEGRVVYRSRLNGTSNTENDEQVHINELDNNQHHNHLNITNEEVDKENNDNQLEYQEQDTNEV